MERSRVKQASPLTHPEGDRLLSLEQDPFPFIIFAGLFTGLLVVSTAVGSKVINIWNITPAASVLPFSLSFVCTDAISELWGKERAKQVVWTGFATILAAFGFFQLAIHWPAASFWKNQEAYSSVLNMSSRIILAGSVAYLASQLHDVWAFHFWRQVTKGKHLWLRNNLSTMTSQLINSILFIGLVFFDDENVPLFYVMFSHYLIKVLIAALDTIPIYIIVSFLRKRSLRRVTPIPTNPS